MVNSQNWTHISWRIFTLKRSNILFYFKIPIRNFYARSFLMFVFVAKMAETYTAPLSLTGILTAVPDMWTGKDIRNYSAFTDSHVQVIPSNNNKLS